MSPARLRVRDVLTDFVLVSRSSARLLLEPLQKAIGASAAPAGTDVVVDFEGIEGMAPSFLDELLGVLHEALGVGTRIHFVSQPARLTLKFEAVARGRGLRVKQEDEGAWLFENDDSRTQDRR